MPDDETAAVTDPSPELGLAPEELARWRATRPGADPAHAADHALACACLARVSGAAEIFTARFLTPIARYLGPVAKRLPGGDTGDGLDELRQRLAVFLLVGDGERGPRLADYNGEGALAGWFRVVATREALQIARRERPSESLTAVHERLADGADAELTYLRQRFRQDFADAFARALAALEPTQRAMLRLHFIEGATTAALATLYGVSRATLVRRLSEAKAALRDATAAALAERVSLSPSEYAELVVQLQSVLEVSITRLLSPS